MQRIVTSLLNHVQAGVFVGTLPVPAEALRDARWDPDVIYLDVRFLRAVSHALNAAIDTRLRKAVLWVETLTEFDQLHVCLRDSRECVGLLDDALAWTATALEHSRMGDRARSELLILRARFLAMDGRMDEAIELARQSAVLAPDNLIPSLNEVELLGRAGRFDEAEALLAQLRALEVAGRGRHGVLEAERLLRMMIEQSTAAVEPSPDADLDVDPGPRLPVFPGPAR